MGGKLAGLGNGLVAVGLHRVPAFQNTRASIDVVLLRLQTAERR